MRRTGGSWLGCSARARPASTDRLASTASQAATDNRFSVNFLRQLVLPRPIRCWTLTTLREKLIKIGAKVVSHSKYVIFQLAEVAAPHKLFVAIVQRIHRLRLTCASG